MKQFFVWAKVFGIMLALVGAFLTVYNWNFMGWVNIPFTIDLVDPDHFMWGGGYALDWLVSFVVVLFALMSFVFAVAEGRKWSNAAYGLPLFALNVFVLFVWWEMELGKIDISFAVIIFSIGILADATAAVIYLLRRFQLPAISA